MAGYVYDLVNGFDREFHFGEGVGDMIRKRTKNSRVVTLQLDGDELDAALWGLDNFQKGQTND